MANHHSKLSYNQVRDFIADELQDPMIGGFHGNVDGYREVLVERLEQAKKALEGFDRGLALRAIANKFSWDAFYINDNKIFIGTAKEAIKLYPNLAEEFGKRI